ncbi:FAD:protein FMN transferase [Mesosutterella sp. OilRF-GAM-744-9]|uniref:FAD:protein FMN transferase n=1 Tax=Mesosutterella porci TaxID=2915351 RepID=A0ABS9MSN3_9BURK|nr:FAD:protein FMN transferase [Mesosutterella sp. oilRF-744-WT-GAM-9]MCG5031632.1 FAD:protein FMN transferase [Mesosutterella sp. oilRF-744-WT-GAM-9]
MLTRRNLLKSLAACSLPVLPAAAAETGSGEPQLYQAEKNTFSMGTLIGLTVYAPTEDKASAWLEAADEEMNRLADILTVHGDSSPMIEVIRQSGRPVAVPEEAAEAVAAALKVAKESDSAFEPTIGKLVDVWKIGFGGKAVPSDKEILRARSFVDWRRVRVFRRGEQDYVQIGRGQDIDLGGIAKGYIGTRMALYLKELGARKALFNLGGNVVVIGSSPAGRPWRIGLQHPAEERNDYFAVLSAEDESVITSGAYERKLVINGRQYGHILSPKTGYPVQTDLSSVTIADRDGAKADAWCTALFAMGRKKAFGMLRRRPDIEAALMSSDYRTVWLTPGLARRCEVTDPAVRKVVLRC